MRLPLIGLLSLVILVLAALPVAAADYAPSLLYATVLNGLILEPDTGALRLDPMYATFLPEAERPPGALHPYAPDQGEKLWAILVRKAEQDVELARFDFYAQDVDAPFWHLTHYRLANPQTGESLGYAGQVELKPGDYRLDFHLKSGTFWTFPFSVSVVKSEDPFRGGDRYYLDGDWRDWGYLNYADADPENMLYWKAWLRHKGAEAERPVTVRITLTRGSDNKLIAINRPEVTWRLGPKWQRVEWPLIEPGDGGALRYGKDLLVDGTYALKMIVADEPYGLWRFEVKGGKLVPAGRTVRAEADPLTFVEGGIDAFWYKRAE
jgi:hypothetical protein